METCRGAGSCPARFSKENWQESCLGHRRFLLSIMDHIFGEGHARPVHQIFRFTGQTVKDLAALIFRTMGNTTLRVHPGKEKKRGLAWCDLLGNSSMYYVLSLILTGSILYWHFAAPCVPHIVFAATVASVYPTFHGSHVPLGH